jgi:uncharacterized membrane protein
MALEKHPRLIGLDIFRGALIWMMIFLHNLDSFSGDLSSIESSGGIASAIGKFIGRWGVFFFIITGFSNSLSMYEKYENPKVNSRKILIKTIIKVLILIVFDRMAALLFSGESKGGGVYDFNAEDAPVTIGIILGLIKEGVYYSPLLYDVFFNQSAVITIGYITLILTLIEILMLRKGGNDKKYVNLVLLGSIGLIILIGSPFAVKYLRPLWVNALNGENYGVAFSFGLLVGDIHPLLPNIGFAFVGAFFGLAFKMRIPRKPIVIYGSIFVLICTIIGIVGFVILGDIPYEMTYQTSPGRAMWLLMGVMLIPTLLIYYFEFDPKKDRKPNRMQLNVQRFGKVSLTMYLLESFIVELLLFGICLLFPLSDSLALLALFGVFVIILMSFLLRLWQKANFAGSAEWLIKKATKY